MKPGETGHRIPYSISVDGDRARVTAVLAGVREEQVMLDFEKKTLVISASDRDLRLRAAVHLPWEARLGAKRFAGGVLQLTLEREDRDRRRQPSP